MYIAFNIVYKRVHVIAYHFRSEILKDYFVGRYVIDVVAVRHHVLENENERGDIITRYPVNRFLIRVAALRRRDLVRDRVMKSCGVFE